MSPNRTPVDRRSVLALGGSLAAVGLFGAACGGNTGRSSSAASSSAGGGKGSVTLQQWYHQYGEAGTQQAVEKYAAAYPDATVTVQWKPGDYDQKAASALLTDAGPGRLRVRQRPHDRHDQGQPGRRPRPTSSADAKADFNAALLERMTYQGKLYAVPQVTDMQLLVYRKCMLEKAGVSRPQTIDELHRRRQEADHRQGQGPVRRQRRRRRRAGRPAAVVGRPGLPHQGQHSSASTTPRPPRRSASCASCSPAGPAARRAHRLVRPVRAHPGPHRDAVDRPVDLPGHQEGPRRRLRRHALARLNGSGGKPSVPVGAYGSCVSAKSQNVDAAKAFVKWLWVDQTDKQLDFAHVLRLPHPGPQEPRGQGRRS